MPLFLGLNSSISSFFFFSAVIACLTLVITSLNEESDRGQTITAKKTE